MGGLPLPLPPTDALEQSAGLVPVETYRRRVTGPVTGVIRDRD